MKLISIIVPAYNVEKYIARCLDSIIAQTYKNLEIIVVDDGSTDRTGDIIDEYVEKDERIKAVHQSNKGLSGARNTALALMKGDYIGFVDGDDYITSDMYRLMLESCEKNNAGICICAYRQEFNVSSDRKAEPQSIERDTGIYVLSREEVLNTYICDDRSYHIYNSVWSKLFRRNIISGFNFPQGRNSEDIMFTTKALVKCDRAVFIDEPLYIYSADRSDSIMNEKTDSRRFNDEIPFLREQTAYIYEQGMNELGKKAEYYFYRRLMFYYEDFRDRDMKASAEKLYRLLKDEADNIGSVYSEDFSKKGDRVRMRLFLKNPALYYRLSKLYAKTVVPIKAARGNNR